MQHLDIPDNIKQLYRTVWELKMKDIIDFNTGEIIEGTATISEIGEALLDYVIQVASGDIQTKARKLRQDDFIPWKRGMSL